ncbi:MAG: hypothetical protein GY765_40020, partial [bacterium]|nr:hypothetical protein [bacterium]
MPTSQAWVGVHTFFSLFELKVELKIRRAEFIILKELMGCRKLAIEKNELTGISAVWKNPALEKVGVGGFFEGKNMRVNYYPGGSLMPGRNGNADKYKFAYQGSEKDDEIT